MSVLTVPGSPLTMFGGPSGEKFTVSFDCTAQLASGDSVSQPSTSLTDTRTNVAITLANAPSVSGNKINQYLDGTQLVVGHQYRLYVTYTANTNKLLAFDLIVVAA